MGTASELLRDIPDLRFKEGFVGDMDTAMDVLTGYQGGPGVGQGLLDRLSGGSFGEGLESLSDILPGLDTGVDDLGLKIGGLGDLIPDLSALGEVELEELRRAIERFGAGGLDIFSAEGGADDQLAELEALLSEIEGPDFEPAETEIGRLSRLAEGLGGIVPDFEPAETEIGRLAGLAEGLGGIVPDF